MDITCSSCEGTPVVYSYTITMYDGRVGDDVTLPVNLCQPCKDLAEASSKDAYL